jgi:8-oxo-dGTP pyrophosphatase MutT (NUDIX family)
MALPAGEDRRPAAVVIPIFDVPPFDVLFVERARHLRRHAGQIGFPGGAVDAGDADHAAGALRELHEEVGIPAGAVTLIGRLPAIRQDRNVFIVTPFIAIVRAGTPLVVDANEASAVHHVPLAEILRPGAIRTGIHTDGTRRIETFILDHGPLHVWGLTARILHSFVEHVHAERSELRHALETGLGAPI